MTAPAPRRARLASQLLVGSPMTTPHAVVAAMGGLQAQDFGSMTWAIGARLAVGTLATVEAAIADASLVRSWPLRGTIHVAPGEDLGWMLRLTAPQALAKTALRRGQHGLTADVLKRGEKAVVQALARGAQRTRAELGEQLAQAGVPLESGPTQHLLFYLALHGVVCLGPRRRGEGTFVMLDAWAPKQRALADDEALATLATRYFRTRAPARADDFAWWTGLPAARAREAMALAGVTGSSPAAPGGSAQLLPGYDEYLLSYRTRSEVLDPAHATRIVPGGNGIFLPMLVVDGSIVGTWKRTMSKRAVRITLAPFAALGSRAASAIRRAAQRYGAFLGLEAELSE